MKKHIPHDAKQQKYNCWYQMFYSFLIGLSLWLAFPPNAFGFMVFVSLSCFILGLERIKSGFWYGYAFYLGAVIAFIGYWFSYYFRLQLGTGYILSYLLTSLICFYTAFYIGIISFAYSRIKTCFSLFNLAFLFPSLWVITELVRGFFFPRSWYALGNTQVDSIIFRGYYPLFGDYFVSWLVVAIAGIIVYCCLNYSFRLWVKLVAGLAVFFTISYFLSGIQYTKPYGKPIKVALVQPNIFSTTMFDLNKQIILENVSFQLASNASADLIILPETIFGIDYHYLTYGYFDKLKNLARQKNARLIFGSPINWPTSPHQTGILDISHPETPIYLKHYLVPFGEYNPLRGTFLEPVLDSIGFRIANYIPGEYKQKPIEMLGQKFVFNLCYENTINDYVAENAKTATILVNQSDLSWYGRTTMKDDSLQFSQARALENQRYFIQDGNSGDTVIINPQGRIEKRLPPFISDTLVSNVQGYSGITPFEFWQNFPIWLLCIISILIALILKYKYKKRLL